MPIFNGLTTNDQVIEAFASRAKGRTFVVTGAGKPSIASQLVLSLASAAPAHILIASRTGANVEPVLEEIKTIDASIKTTFIQIDLSDRDSVRVAAQEICAAAPEIDVLINSAGVMALKGYTLDKQGVEMQFSVNHVGHFLLTNLIMPSLIAAATRNGGARIVNLTSSGYMISQVRFDDWNFSGGKTYDHWTGYGQAKAANVLFAYGLNAKLKKLGITSTAAHPGYTTGTRLGNHLSMEDYGEIAPTMKRNTGIDWTWEEPRLKSLDQIAATPLIAALDPELPSKSPAYLVNGQAKEPEAYASSAETAERLWTLSEEIVGQKFQY
ncbi:Short-chain dehydrogenase TIC 32, chloroplastic [Paramyrothecium foliicola]|nr:Short-chain dehydrogenase TIC 32, chloroplastic [Paramyrothecium foliicola]